MPKRTLKVEIEVEEAPRRKGRKRRGGRRDDPEPGPCECSAGRVRPLLLAFARRLARGSGRLHPLGLSTVDDVHEGLARNGHSSASLGPAAGAIFRGEEWQSTRLRVRSRRPLARGREIKVWRLACKRSGDLGAPDGKGAPPGFACLIDDYLSLDGLPVEAATEPPRTCPLCRDFPGCVGFCEHFDLHGKGPDE